MILTRAELLAGSWQLAPAKGTLHSVQHDTSCLQVLCQVRLKLKQSCQHFVTECVGQHYCDV
jgi:hypothetical protein